MKLIVSRYNNDLSWLPLYTDDYLIYDKSETPLPDTIKIPNVGYNIYTYLTYLIDYYDNLPEVFTLCKGNLFQHITGYEYGKVKDNQFFTPLLTRRHETYAHKGLPINRKARIIGGMCEYCGIKRCPHLMLPVCFYSEDGLYNEINNSNYLRYHPHKYFNDYDEFAAKIGIPSPDHLKFAPGCNYIMTKDCVLKYPKSFYEQLISYVDYCQLPGEAHILERAWYTMFLPSTTSTKF